MATQRYPLKATSNILNLLGDELIGSDILAIFELVKNSYDADANEVNISFVDLNTPEQKIIIEDDGCGMTAEIIHKVWLIIGTNYKKREAKVSQKYKRLSLGNKGVGRLAVHRLAESILLETKTEDDLFGSYLEINWQNLVSSGEFIDDLYVDVNEGILQTFPKGHGTRITLKGLKNKYWTKVQLRDLVRKIDNFKNPFQTVPNFNVNIHCDEDKQQWIEDVKSGIDILKESLYCFKFKLSPIKENTIGEDSTFAKFEWEYAFQPHAFNGLKDNRITSDPNTHLPINPQIFVDDETKRGKYYLQNSDLDGIGEISGQFYVFNQSRQILDLIYGVGRNNAIKEYIKSNCGVKVYRNDIRVYNYGEPFDDWLNLELAKVQRAGDHFSKKVTIGAISIKLGESSGLGEKTNREGFLENETFNRFREIVRTTFSYFERTADNDKQNIEAALADTTPNKRVGLSDTIRELEAKVAEKQLTKELQPLIKKVERDYNEMRDVMLNSGMTGLNLAIVFHEIEREMRYISTDLNSQQVNVAALKKRIKNLNLLLENFAPILKQRTNNTLLASALIDRAVQINQSRLNYHGIDLVAPILKEKINDFKITGPGNLLLSSLSNIIDNAIYWVSAQHELKGEKHKSSIYIDTDLSAFDGPSIIIADTGNGFQLDPEDLVQPFKTTKEGGMGLGLYFVNLVMESMGGKLYFPDNKDMNIPQNYEGACIALIFSKMK